MKISAVLFDLDGTLTDSTRIFYEAVEKAMTTLGHTMERDIFLEWHGNHTHWQNLLLHHKGDGSQWETLKQLSSDHFDAMLSRKKR